VIDSLVQRILDDPYHFQGLTVIESDIAETRVVTVERHPIKKRRRNWFVRIRWEPTVFMDGRRLICHPYYFEAVRAAVPPEPQPTYADYSALCSGIVHRVFTGYR